MSLKRPYSLRRFRVTRLPDSRLPSVTDGICSNGVRSQTASLVSRRFEVVGRWKGTSKHPGGTCGDTSEGGYVENYLHAGRLVFVANQDVQRGAQSRADRKEP